MENTRYALLTGATGGLGGAIAQALSGTGRWTVFAAGTNETALAELARLPHVTAVRMDITRQESVDEACAGIRLRTDTLDAVVHFAGMSAFGSMVEPESVDQVRRLLDVNVIGMVRVNQVFFPMVLHGHGRIILCSSEAGWMTPQPFAGAYFLSKHALETYSDSLRREVMFMGIPVVKIQPGFHRTRMTDSVLRGYDEAVRSSAWFSRILKRMKPLMMHELTRRNRTDRLARVVLRAMESRHPRIRYRVGTGFLLRLLELLPGSGVDRLYRILAGRDGRAAGRPHDQSGFS